jgi:4-amino-4-deoxy-L-arabinose transferase-like glycosyltransferase
MSSPFIQNLIHQLENGAGSRYLRILALALGVVALAFLYDLRAYRNFATPEAMDTAQLARNISDGHGYTTLCIRPFSLYLVQRHNEPHNPATLTNSTPDWALIKTVPHPDLANPPAYPLVLAGLMKVLPFHYPVNLKSTFWSNNGGFWWYQPDFLIALFNQLLFLVVAVLTFLLGKKLFDPNVARLSAVLVLGCEMLWRFSASGLSTMLLLVIFLGLTLLLLEIERCGREPVPPAGRLLGLAVAAGLLTGIGALTRYAFGWTIIPVALFLVFFSGPKHVRHLLATLAVFTVVLTPWIMRNEAVSGTAFGTAGYAVFEGTYVFPRFQLERSIHPDFNVKWLALFLQKLLGNLRENLTADLLKSGATWAGGLFFAGLFIGFRSPGARRGRYFLLMCLGVFIFVQSLGRTQLSELSPDINSEDLLVLLVPLVFIFGGSFFFTLLDQMTLPLIQLRYAVITGFVALCCLPLAFVLLPPKTAPVVYPPYFPPEIQQIAGWMKPDELTMSDVPWAVAWYGNRQSVWLSLDTQTDFFAMYDYVKPVRALYLTPVTMDGKFVTDWVLTHDVSWGNFVVDAVIKHEFSPGFPLRFAPSGFLPDRLFLTDRERWKEGQ